MSVCIRVMFLLQIGDFVLTNYGPRINRKTEISNIDIPRSCKCRRRSVRALGLGSVLDKKSGVLVGHVVGQYARGRRTLEFACIVVSKGF